MSLHLSKSIVAKKLRSCNNSRIQIIKKTQQKRQLLAQHCGRKKKRKRGREKERKIERGMTTQEGEKEKKTIKIVCMSDTHCIHHRVIVPDGDIFIHSGDFTRMGSVTEIREFNAYLKTLPHKHKIIIAGNHDFGFERWPEEAQKELLNGTKNCYYLQDSSITIEGINFYGSPWQPKFHKWAFNLERGQQLKEKWDLIPPNTDILITHGPPYGILDKTIENEKVGCEELLLAVKRIKPKYHIFGHVHEGRGKYTNGITNFINASNLTATYRPAYEVITFDYLLP